MQERKQVTVFLPGETQERIISRFNELAVVEQMDRSSLRDVLKEEFSFQNPEIGKYDVMFSKHLAALYIRTKRSHAYWDRRGNFKELGCTEIIRTAVQTGKHTLTLIVHEYTIEEEGVTPTYALEFERHKTLLEFSDIAPYVPYGLEVVCLNGKKEPFAKGIVTDIQCMHLPVHEIRFIITIKPRDLYSVHLHEMIPLLKPIPDLIQTPDQFGEYQKMMNCKTRGITDHKDPTGDRIEFNPKRISTLEMSRMVNWCYERKYDINNLIADKLAWDINKESEIAYKKR